MEFILVNSVKLKIMLTPQDMMDCGLSDIAENSFSHAAMRKILDRAHSETGFDTKHAKLYVQAFPAPDGSLELFLTRRSRLLPEPDEETRVFRKTYHLSSESRSRKEYIAVSDGIDELADLSIRMHKDRFHGESALYVLGKYYYLWIGFTHRLPSFIQHAPEVDRGEEADRFAYLSEYAAVSYADRMTLAKLSERGKALIDEKAVETLSSAFAGT